MQANLLTTVLLPLALAVIMFGLGLSLSLDDFRRVARFPLLLAVVLSAQTLALPLVAWGLARGFGLPPPLTLGLVLIAACPTGATAAVFAQLGRGDVALAMTLTAANCAVSAFTLPLTLELTLRALGEGRDVPVDLPRFAQIVGIILGPASVGLWVRARWLRVAERLAPPLRTFSLLFLAAIVAVAVITERERLPEALRACGAAVALLNVTLVLTGLGGARLAGLPLARAVTVATQLSIRNSTIAIALAVSPALLADPRASVPGALYALVMYATAAVVALVVRRWAPAAAGDGVAPGAGR